MDKLIEVCISSKLTPDEYCILSLLSNRQYEKIRSLFDLELISEANFVSLETKGYIKLLGAFGDTISFESIGIREKTNKLFKSDESADYVLFLDLWNRYPMKVPNKEGGYRKLKAVNIDSDGFRKSFKKWKNIIGKDHLLPNTMIKALDKQLTEMRDSLSYMKMFDTWLNSSEWEKYVDFNVEDEQIKETEAI